MRIRRVFTEEFKRSVVAQCENENPSDVARQHGIVPSLLHYWRSKFDINFVPSQPRSNNYVRYSAEIREQVINECKTSPVSSVAVKYNIPYATVSKWCVKALHQKTAANNSSVEIETNIPLPTQSTRNTVQWPWTLMDVGHSFFAPGYITRKSDRVGKIFSVRTGKKAIPGSSWVVRECVKDGVNGVRVWRSA